MKHCFKRWIKTKNVNVSNETYIGKCVLSLLICTNGMKLFWAESEWSRFQKNSKMDEIMMVYSMKGTEL